MSLHHYPTLNSGKAPLPCALPGPPPVSAITVFDRIIRDTEQAAKAVDVLATRLENIADGIFGAGPGPSPSAAPVPQPASYLGQYIDVNEWLGRATARLTTAVERLEKL